MGPMKILKMIVMNMCFIVVIPLDFTCIYQYIECISPKAIIQLDMGWIR